MSDQEPPRRPGAPPPPSSAGPQAEPPEQPRSSADAEQPRSSAEAEEPLARAEAEDVLTADEAAVVAHARAVPEGSDADLWAFAFDSSLRAQEALLASMRLVARQHLKLGDAAIVAKVRGRVRITQTKDVSPSQGAVGGAWIGILAGLFLGPGGPLVGGALGAAAGGLFAKLRDFGIDDDEMKRMGEELSEGEAALFLLVEDCHRMRALHEVSRFPGRLLATTAAAEVVEEVRGRLAVDPWDAF